MSPLPMSVRLSLWGTRVLTGDVPSAAVDRLVTPDVERAQSVRPHLEMWAAFGERVLLVALPAPGNPGLVPRGNTSLLRDAVSAGECVFVPTVGGALVPYGADGEPGVSTAADEVHPERIETHRAPGVSEGEDHGPLDLTWQRFDADPVETWQLDALSVREVSRHLRSESDAALDLLSQAHQPWTSRGLRSLADAALGAASAEALGVPEKLPPATLKLISDAAALGHAARLGLAVPDDGSAHEAALRRDALRRLSVAADTALATATCIASLNLAGLRPDRPDDF